MLYRETADTKKDLEELGKLIVYLIDEPMDHSQLALQSHGEGSLFTSWGNR